MGAENTRDIGLAKDESADSAGAGGTTNQPPKDTPPATPSAFEVKDEDRVLLHVVIPTADFKSAVKGLLAHPELPAMYKTRKPEVMTQSMLRRTEDTGHLSLECSKAFAKASVEGVQGIYRVYSYMVGYDPSALPQAVEKVNQTLKDTTWGKHFIGGPSKNISPTGNFFVCCTEAGAKQLKERGLSPSQFPVPLV